MNFSALKKTSSFESLQQKVKETLAPSGNYGDKDDERFWSLQTDKSGNGYAIIRFLPTPAVDGEDGDAWVKSYKHGFQGPGGWFIEECPTTIGQPCVVCDSNRVAWNSGIEANKKIASDRKRKLTYYSNIIVINDPSNPDNNGQLKLFKYGQKIFEKIAGAMSPEFEDETPINPFDFWTGANFKIKARGVGRDRNYDKSEFDSPSALFDGDDARLEALWKQEHSLKAFVDPSKFKTYEQLQQRYNKVIGEIPFGGSKTNPAVSKFESNFDDDIDEEAMMRAVSKPTSNPVNTSVNEDDDSLDYFRSLVEE